MGRCGAFFGVADTAGVGDIASDDAKGCEEVGGVWVFGGAEATPGTPGVGTVVSDDARFSSSMSTEHVFVCADATPAVVACALRRELQIWFSFL